MCAKLFRETNIMNSFGKMITDPENACLLAECVNAEGKKYAFISNGAYAMYVKRSLIRAGGRLDKMLIDAGKLAGENKVVRVYLDEVDKDIDKYLKVFEYEEWQVVDAEFKDEVRQMTNGKKLYLVQYENGLGGFDKRLVDIIPDKKLLVDGVFTKSIYGPVQYQAKDKDGSTLVKMVLMPYVVPGEWGLR